MTQTTAVHWVGAGLASGSGIISLAEAGVALTVWDQTPDRAEMLREELSPNATMDICTLDLAKSVSVAEFMAKVEPNDVIVSMLPAALQMQMAEIAL